MSAPQSPLPEFRSPPVSEVVLGVQFQPIELLRTPQLGLVWQEFRDRFPKVEEKIPLDPSFDILAADATAFSVQLQVERADAFPSPRLWFVNEDGTRLLQLQRDRFIHNWRRLRLGDEYPRYARVRETLAQELTIFQQFLQNQRLGEIIPNQCEVTYVNEFHIGREIDSLSDVGNLFSLWSPRYQGGFLPPPDHVGITVRYPIHDNTGDPLGRLQVSIQPVVSQTTGKVAYLMRITAQGRQDGSGLEGAFRFLDIGHEWAVRGFEAMTTPSMHRIWERNDASTP